MFSYQPHVLSHALITVMYHTPFAIVSLDRVWNIADESFQRITNDYPIQEGCICTVEKLL